MKQSAYLLQYKLSLSFLSIYQAESVRNTKDKICNSAPWKGRNEREVEIPKIDKTENPHEEQPVEMSPMSVAPPTDRWRDPLRPSQRIVLIISRILIPTSIALIIRMTESKGENAVKRPPKRVRRSSDLEKKDAELLTIETMKRPLSKKRVREM